MPNLDAVRLPLQCVHTATPGVEGITIGRSVGRRRDIVAADVARLEDLVSFI